MACRQTSAKPLYETILDYCRLDALLQNSVKFESKHYTFIKHAIEKIVYGMVAILSLGE